MQIQNLSSNCQSLREWFDFILHFQSLLWLLWQKVETLLHCTVYVNQVFSDCTFCICSLLSLAAALSLQSSNNKRQDHDWNDCNCYDLQLLLWMRGSLRTINLQAVLLGRGAGRTGGCAGVGGCVRPLSTGDLQLATSWQNSEALVWLELRTCGNNTPRLGTVFRHVTHTVSSTSYSVFVLLLLSLCVLLTHTHIPSFLQVRLGGGMPLDSHTSAMRLPSITVRGDTSSDPRMLGETVMMRRHQREAHTSQSSISVESSPELKTSTADA